MAKRCVASSLAKASGWAVARDIVEVMIDGRLEVVGAERIEMVKRNRVDPGAVDEALRPMKASMEEASRNHSAL